MKNSLKIEILDPKVRGLLQELEYLGHIKIVNDSIEDIKLEYFEKLKGKNLKEL